MSEINPNAKPRSGEFYLADLNRRRIGETITKGFEDNDACIFATESMDECIFLDGCGYIYKVEGTTCRHYYAPTIGGTRETVFGGYRDVTLTEQYPLSVQMFDTVTVLEEVPLDTFFGPNGRQVAHIVTWVRSKFKDDGETLVPEAGFSEVIRQVAKYAGDRLKRQVLPVPLDFGLSSRGLSGEFTSEPTNRFWLKPWRLAHAWKAAFETASRSGRLYRCKWLGFLPLIGLVLRDVLQPATFLELYAGLEPFYPIATLDNEVRGTLYKV